MAREHLNRRSLLRTGLATTAALGAAALPGLGWATAAGSHPVRRRRGGGTGQDSDRDDRDDGGRGRPRASGQVIRTWNEIACAQAFGNGTRLSRILAIMHAAQHDAVNGADPRYEPYASTLSDPKRGRRGRRRRGGAPGPRRLLPGQPGGAGRPARELARERPRRSGRGRRRGARPGGGPAHPRPARRRRVRPPRPVHARRRGRACGSRRRRRSRRWSSPSSRTSGRSRSATAPSSCPIRRRR